VHDTDGVDVAVVGVPFDTATSYRAGARFGPEAIRAGSTLLRPYHPALGVNVFAGQSVVDWGDIEVTPGNAERTVEQIEAELRAQLGVERVVWLGLGLVEDRDTDGHVDNICAFVEPGRVVLQTVADESNPNYAGAQDNLRRLRDAGLEVVELPWLPYATDDTVVPYTNYYVCNGGLIVPTRGEETDAEALALLESLYPGREAVAVAGETLAHGGGGVHCITQQVPAA
jgi:agmatine deiminase